MAGYLSDAIKTEIEGIWNLHHESWADEFYYFLEKEILTITADANYNYGYGMNQDGVTKSLEAVSGMITGRIQYVPIITLSRRAKTTYPDENIPLVERKSLARLKVDAAGYEIVKQSKQIVLPDGKTYVWKGPTQAIGPFNLNYTSLLLEEVK
jgi:hypothetical protein